MTGALETSRTSNEAAGDERPLLHLAHSPDPDDAFMWWPLFELNGTAPKLDTGRFRFEPVTEDIEVLNQRSAAADLAITAMSCAQYPHVADRYAITSCGASMGDAYGPKLVAREVMPVEALRERDLLVAVPGTRTSAFGALSLILGAGSFRHEVVPFDRIIDAVADGSVDAGLVIHEGQLTFEAAGLHKLVDVGTWWTQTTGLPMPLGVNCIRRDLEEAHGPGTLKEVTATLLRSVEYALEHREASIAYALDYARDMGAELADEFVAMYVNRWTLDFGDQGRTAVAEFLGRLAAIGLVPQVTPEFV
ncbi:MAG: menaquinone biosynthesis family protein [Planctomycetota bacterium]|jgi:1,4-dihydroxy-6-naphthoate synthase